jgi:uncharacterized membrane protein YcaP (DUF421 family)
MNPTVFFLDGWEPVGRILVIGTLGYAALVILLRATGKRTLARMNPFDFVITVTLGATFGRVMTASEVGLVELVAAFLVLIGLQYAASLVRLRSPALAAAIDSPPSLLFYRGRFLKDAMRRERVGRSDLETAARVQGLGSFAEVEAIVLESDGRLAVIRSGSVGDGSTLESLRGPVGI